MIGKCIVNTKLAGEPFCQRLETSTQNGHFVPERLQALAQFVSTGRDLDHGFELVKDVCWYALEQANTLLERFRKVKLPIHSTFRNFLACQVSYPVAMIWYISCLISYRDLLFHPDKPGDLINNLILDQCAIHIEHN